MNFDSYKVIIMRGIPGSGKSQHIRRTILPEFRGNSFAIVSADHYFEHKGKYWFDASKLQAAHADCFDKYLEHLRNCTELIVVDNTNLRAWEISPYILGANAASIYSYEVEIHEIRCEPQFAASRNIHGVDEAKVMAMDTTRHNEVLPPFWKRRIFDAVTDFNTVAGAG